MLSPDERVSRDGRLVVVTGGSKGVGRAIVSRFAQLGDSIVSVGRDDESLRQTTKELQDKGYKVTYRCCDITVPEAVQDLFAQLDAVDVLVNNAGISTSAPIDRTTLEDWSAQIAVNATGAFLCSRAVIPSMRERNSGRIVFVASTAGIVGYPYSAGYVVSKHAEVGLMRAIATELAGTKVTANAVCPSYVRTQMTDRSIQRIVATTGRSEKEALNALVSSSPLRRLLEPHEVAAAVVFLVSDEAVGINGQAMIIDGGGIQR